MPSDRTPGQNPSEDRQSPRKGHPRAGAPLPNLAALLAQAGKLSPARVLSLLQSDQRKRWQHGERILVEAYLEHLPALQADPESLLDFIYSEVVLREQNAQTPTLEEYLRRFPKLEDRLRRQFVVHDALDSLSEGTETLPPPPGDTRAVPQPGPLRITPAQPGEMPEQFGRYHIEKLLGRGGMGAVYLAQDTEQGRSVALKVPNFTLAEGSVALQRFYREAQAAAVLNHPNICPVYDFGEVDGIPYLTMAHIQGRALSEVIRSQPLLSQREAAKLVHKLALALKVAHGHGVIHRDLKPANIMLTGDNEPVIMDFGLARWNKEGDIRLTPSGDIIGTPAYMSPEQVNGEVQAIGPHTDIYSLGVLLYEVLTKSLPFKGGLSEVLAKVTMEEPELPSTLRPDLDPQLEAICRKAMAKKIEARYPSMQDLAEALSAFLKPVALPPAPPLPLLPGDPRSVVKRSGTHAMVTAPSPPPGEPSWRKSREAPKGMLPRMAAAILIVTITGLLLYWGVAVRSRGDRSPDTPGQSGSQSTEKARTP